jgi:hypothetical protein
MAGMISRVSLIMRSSSQRGAFPPCRGKLAIPVRGVTVDDISALNYEAQVEQFPEAQLAQEFPPTADVTPLSSAEKQAKVDNTRLAPL